MSVTFYLFYTHIELYVCKIKKQLKKDMQAIFIKQSNNI